MRPPCRASLPRPPRGLRQGRSWPLLGPVMARLGSARAQRARLVHPAPLHPAPRRGARRWPRRLAWIPVALACTPAPPAAVPTSAPPASPPAALDSSGSPLATPAASEPEDRWAQAAPLETLRGRASYYADSLAGNSTASGEPYDPAALTAAHRTLPFGTVVRVRSLASSRSVVVRINDRGPFGDRRRIIDLSRAAATELEMLRAGVIEVEVDVLERDGQP